jgi:heptosyltransferase-3
VRLLIIRPGALGDCILALPAMEHLRAGYTEVWAARPNLPLFRFADCTRAIADTGLDLAGIPGHEPSATLFERLASFDAIVSWYGANRPEFRESMAGFPFRLLPALPAGGAGIHAADFFLLQAGGTPPAIPRLDCRREPGGYAVIHPFSGSARKNWPLECFRDVAGRLPLRVCWCAGPEEHLDGAVRFDNVYELACWLANAAVYIGNDSGVTHLAAASGAPVVALFGPTDPASWGRASVEAVVETALGIAAETQRRREEENKSDSLRRSLRSRT